MNNAPLNTYTLNGELIDPVVRTSVTAVGRALGSATSRVLAYFSGDVVVRAGATPIGRVQSRLAVTGTPTAQVAPTARVFFRSLIQSYASADIEATISRVRAIVVATCRATASADYGVLVRFTVSSAAAAQAAVIALPRRRAPIASLIRSVVDTVGRVRSREYVRGPLTAAASAGLSTAAKTNARLLVSVGPEASASASTRVIARSQVTASAVASMDIGFDVNRSSQWTGFATEENTLLVPAEVYEFEVM